MGITGGKGMVTETKEDTLSLLPLALRSAPKDPKNHADFTLTDAVLET